jgi:diamine N-acetyltransferase
MLRSDNIYLRSLESTDLNLLYDWENDTENWEVSGTLTPFSKDILKSFIDNSDKDIYTTKQYRFIICFKNNLPIGTIDLFDFDPQHLRAGIGILIGNKEYRGKGFSKEALKLLIDYCLKTLKLTSLFCTIEESNIPSIKLFESLKFSKSGIKYNWIRKNDGKYYNVGFYQLML